MVKKNVDQNKIRLDMSTVKKAIKIKSTTPSQNIFSWSIFSQPNSINSINNIHTTKNLTGKNIKVAILDTGINTNHICFQNNIKGYRNFTGGDINDVTDRVGHGSHCAGIVAATSTDNIKISVAPDAHLYIGKVLGDDGSGSVNSITEGIYWAIESKVDIISMSLGYTGTLFPDIKEAIDEAINNDIIVCVAAGNEGPKKDTVSSPGNYTRCVTVGAVDRKNRIANFSSRGVQLDVVVPGVNIISCYHTSPTSFAFMSGTSMATPFLAGVAALFLEQHSTTPYENPNNLKRCQLFEKWCKDNCLDMGKKGFDDTYGSGRPFLNFP